MKLASKEVNEEKKRLLENYYTTRKQLINVLNRDLIESWLRTLIKDSGFIEDILKVKEVIDKKEMIAEAMANYKPYQDPTGKHLNLFYSENTDLWIRANLSEGINYNTTFVKDTSFLRSADFSIIIKKNDVSAVTQRNFEQVNENFRKVWDGKTDEIEPLESLIEIPIGIKTLDAKIQVSSGEEKNCSIIYPDSIRDFEIQFQSNSVWGVFDTDKVKQERFLNFLGIPESFGFKLVGVKPNKDPQKFKFEFQITTPEFFDGLLDSASTYELSITEMQDVFDGSLEKIGLYVKKQIEDQIEAGLKELLDENRKQLERSLSRFPFLNRISNISIKKSKIESATLKVGDKDIKIDKGELQPIVYLIEYLINRNNWPEFIEFPVSEKIEIEIQTQYRNGYLSHEFKPLTALKLNSKYLDNIKSDLKDLADDYDIDIDFDKKTVLLNIYNLPLEIDVLNGSLRAKVLYETIPVGDIIYENGQVDYRLNPLTKEIIERIIKDGINNAVNRGKRLLQNEFCIWLANENFFIGSIPDWQELTNECNPLERTFKKTWKHGESNDRFGIEGKFNDEGVPQISKLDYSFLTNALNKYAQTLKEKINNFQYVKFGNGDFTEEGNFEVPIYMNIDLFESFDSNAIGSILIKRDGSITFNSNNLDDAIMNKMDLEIEAKMNEMYFSTPYEYIILDQEISLIECSQVKTRENKIVFKGEAKIFGEIKVYLDIIYENGKIRFEPTDADIDGIQQMISADLGIADINATANLSLNPIGIRGVAKVQLFGLSFPPFDYLLTNKGLDYKLATSIPFIGAYPISPGVVMIDPTLTLDTEQKKIRANTIVTIGASEEARLTARLIKLNAFLNFPLQGETVFTYGGDFVALSIMPLMKGRGLINVNDAYFEHKTTTNKTFSELIDYNSSVVFNGEEMSFNGGADLKLLDEIKVGLELIGKVPKGFNSLDLKGNGNANLVFANFEVGAKTKIIFGLDATTSALINANMRFKMNAGKELLGVDIASVEGDASIDHAKFNIGLLGAEFGVTLPGPNDLDDDVIIDILKKMFDLKIDLEDLFEVENLNDVLKFNPSSSFSNGKISFNFNDADTGKGKNINGSADSGAPGNIQFPGGSSPGSGTGKLIEGNITHPNEKILKRERKSTSCPWYKPFSDCFKWVNVPYDKFKPNVWPRLFPNLPSNFRDGSMIFDTISDPDTGNVIKSLIAPIQKERVRIDQIRGNYDFLLTDLSVVNRYKKPGNQYSLCEGCDESSGTFIKFNDSLDIQNKLAINLGFDRKSDDVKIFVSYKLNKNNSQVTGQKLLDDLEELKKYQNQNTELSCENCRVFTDSIWTRKNHISLSLNRDFYKRNGNIFNRNKFESIEDGDELPSISYEDAEEGDEVEISVEDLLDKLDKKYNYIVKSENQFIAFESISDIQYYESQTKEQDLALYSLTGKTWISINEQVLLNQLVNTGTSSPRGNEDLRTWIERSIKSDVEFSNALSKVLNKVISTNGELKLDLINIEELNLQLLVLGSVANGTITSAGAGTIRFVVVNPGDSGLKKGESFDFNLYNRFGSYYDSVKSNFGSLENIKSYFESQQKPVLRNFVVYSLILGNDIDEFFGVNLNKDRILLARTDKLVNDFWKYKLLSISSGELSSVTDLKNWQSEANLSMHKMNLSKGYVKSLEPVIPFNQNSAHWDEYFSQYEDKKRYWVSTISTEDRIVVSMRANSTNDINYYWLDTMGDNTISEINSNSIDINIQLLKNKIDIIDPYDNLNPIFSLLNKSIYNSEEWYSKEILSSPFGLMRN